VTFNQSPPLAVCAVGALKEKAVPVLAMVRVCGSGLEPTGIVKYSGDT